MCHMSGHKCNFLKWKSRVSVEPANAERSRDASRHIYARFGYRVTYNIPSLKMATTDPESFGKPTLLLGSNVPLDVNDATTFTSNGLLDTGLFARSGDGGEGENAPPSKSPSWTACMDGVGSADDDELSTFTSNGLLDAPTEMTSTVNSSRHLCGISSSPTVLCTQVRHLRLS